MVAAHADELLEPFAGAVAERGREADRVVRLVVGSLVVEGWYDAYPAEAEFRSGRLVRLKVGDRPDWQHPDGGPLTIGFTHFPGLLSVVPLGRLHVLVDGLAAAYAGGELAGEAPLGEVHVNLEHLAPRGPATALLEQQ